MDVNTCTCTRVQLIIPKGLYNEQILLHGITDIQSYLFDGVHVYTLYATARFVSTNVISVKKFF